MKRIILVICLIIFFQSCHIIFTTPYSANYHNENEIGGIPTGNFSTSSDSYGYVYYVTIGESYIEIYIFNNDNEIVDVAIGTYSVEYLWYTEYEGEFQYKYIFDDSLGTLVESDYKVSHFDINAYINVDVNSYTDVYLRVYDFNNDTLYCGLNKTFSEIEKLPYP